MAIHLAHIRNLLIDMDGVLYRGQTALPGAAELIAFLKERGLGYLLVTNNATMSQAQFSDKLRKMGIEVPPEAIMTSSLATASYLATIAPPGTKVNVVGEEALVKELEKRGFVIAGRDAQYVVCGLDRTLTYEKLATATIAIRRGATFIGTNADKTYPLEKDLIPGAGSILASLIAATDVQPMVIGKPEPAMFQQALALLGAKAEETAMLGDRPETDILGGHRAGLATILVLTGVSTREAVERCEVQPDLIVEDLPALIRLWRAALNGEGSH
jgi:4-nitrophenyl phosphatase